MRTAKDAMYMQLQAKEVSQSLGRKLMNDFVLTNSLGRLGEGFATGPGNVSSNCSCHIAPDLGAKARLRN